MSNKILIPIVILGFLCLALSPEERKIAQRALDNLKTGKQQFEQVTAELKQAQDAAAESDSHATRAELALVPLQRQIEISHHNEQTLGNEVAKYKPIVDRCNSYWGLGAIGYGISRLVTHVLVLIAVLLAIAVAVFFLTGGTGGVLLELLGTFGRFLLRALRTAGSFLWSLTNLFHSHPSS